MCEAVLTEQRINAQLLITKDYCDWTQFSGTRQLHIKIIYKFNIKI